MLSSLLRYTLHRNIALVNTGAFTSLDREQRRSNVYISALHVDVSRRVHRWPKRRTGQPRRRRLRPAARVVRGRIGDGPRSRSIIMAGIITVSPSSWSATARPVQR